MPNLYWKNAAEDQKWDNVLNWFTDAAATTQASAIPWVADNVYKTYDLRYATGESSGCGNGDYNLTIGSTLFTITGTCYLDLTNMTYSFIKGGNYAGSFSYINEVAISGGSFSGTLELRGGSSISSGTFLAQVDMMDTSWVSGGDFYGLLRLVNNLGYTFGPSIGGGNIWAGLYADQFCYVNGGNFYAGPLSLGNGVTGAAIFKQALASYTLDKTLVKAKIAGSPGVELHVTLPQLDILGTGLL